MGRKDYLADLGLVAASPLSYGVLSVTSGEESEALVVQVDSRYGPVNITAHPDETSSYPTSHAYLMSVDDSAPNEISGVVASLTTQLGKGTTIPSLCRELSYRFSVDADGDTEMPDSQLEDDEEDYSDSESLMDDELFGFGNERPSVDEDTRASATYDNLISIDARNNLRQDLKLVKEAGFKVGIDGPLIQGHPAYMTISCRVSKLGISEEAMQAWRLLPNEYLTLLVHFPRGYIHIGHIEETVSGRGMLDFRFGVGSSYRPSRAEIGEAFTTLSPDAQSENADSKSTNFRKLFISGPLQDLFSEKFVILLKCRIKGMSWNGAMSFWHDHQGTSLKGELAQDPKYHAKEKIGSVYPSLVMSDHITKPKPGHRISLPLVAMQFFVRQVVRCTEFCLVCHRKMPTDIEAIKPYVCDSQLCLYQYMQLGFGPSIEHEIITQPKVVDLLISLCFSSASRFRLKQRHLPKGLDLRVPRIDILKMKEVAATHPYQNLTTEEKKPALLPSEVVMLVKANIKSHELLFDKGVTRDDTGLKHGDWILLQVSAFPEVVHCRIEDMAMFPAVKFSHPIVLPMGGRVQNLDQGHALPDYLPARFITYSEDFDTFSDTSMQEAVAFFINILPSVSDMRQYLLKGGPQASLRKWTRMTAPSLALLRWIIASNRACIMHIGDKDDGQDAQLGTTKEDQVWGMPGYTQFRIAMGAPDKERRFLNSVKTIAADMKLAIPTIFAWHGSELGNWHSIIRDGLNFDETRNGRAYGHGVYFAKDMAVSAGYSHMSYVRDTSQTWRSSDLSVCNAISLNEIANAPDKFVSSKPYFVVDKVDWIQTRYLFVKSTSIPGQENRAPNTPEYQELPSDPIPQDPVHFPINERREKIIVPATASRSRTKVAKTTGLGHAIRVGFKRIKTGEHLAEPDDDDKSSVMTDVEDREMLELESEGTDSTAVKASSSKTFTDFKPGELDYQTLEILPPPENSAASMLASKRLGTSLKDVAKLQESQPLHELGWYIDTGKTDNIYQWIFELHTFESHLPLAQDMKAMGVKSVVLEFIFGPEFPFAPPFVRVIRPRFLPFQQGGGGHVTAGGALCMELLTNDGWSSASSIEAVLLQVRLAMSSTEPRPARLERHFIRDYTIGEAVEAYIRACQVHGWTVPSGFKQMVYAGRNNRAMR